jgi:osmotically-inducible protein OsmY
VKQQALTLALSAMVALGSAGWAFATDPTTTGEAAENAPDNSGRNARDSDGNTLTPGDQGDSEADVALTQKIRQKVVADDSLSMLAHNVKIITLDGVVTLRGPVESPKEKERIAAVAKEIAGAGKVKDNLEVAQ